MVKPPRTYLCVMFVCLFICLFIHLFIYLIIHLFIYLFIYSIIHSFIHLFIYLLIHSFPPSPLLPPSFPSLPVIQQPGPFGQHGQGETGEEAGEEARRRPLVIEIT